MGLKIGIVGLPNVGKSTLFKALTRKQADIANYPFCTIEPNVGVVEVPDPRLTHLTELSHSKKTVPAIIEFVDIAGIVKGAAEGEGLGNKFLSHIRDVDAIVEVVRVFEDKDIIHVADKVNPASDIETIEYELILKDLENVSSRLQTIERDIKAGKKGAVEEQALLERAKKELDGGRLLHRAGIATQLSLLTEKPFIYVWNVSESQLEKNWQPDSTLKEKIGNAPYLVISSKVEAELAELSQEERKEYLSSLGQTEAGLDKLIRTGYETLGLMTFFTTGEDETRAWTIPRGSKAPRAGRAIHSDFEEKFIRAEIVPYEKLIEAGSIPAARERGWLGIEGKEYEVHDGDVIEFRI